MAESESGSLILYFCISKYFLYILKYKVFKYILKCKIPRWIFKNKTNKQKSYQKASHSCRITCERSEPAQESGE